MRRRTKDGLVIFMLCMVICIGIGYAALSETLTLNGTATILGSNNWKIHFVTAACAPINQSKLLNPTLTTITFPDASALTGNFSAVLVPGETAEYHVQIINEGTIPGKYMGNTITPTGTIPTFGESNTPCFTCEVRPATNQYENPIYKGSIDHEFIVSVKCNENITQLPTEDTKASFTITFNYEQVASK